MGKTMPFLPSMTGNINEGYPNSWMVDVVENPNLKWMIRGNPIYGNLLICFKKIQNHLTLSKVINNDFPQFIKHIAHMVSMYPYVFLNVFPT